MFKCHNSGEVKYQVITIDPFILTFLQHFECSCTLFLSIVNIEKKNYIEKHIKNMVKNDFFFIVVFEKTFVKIFMKKYHFLTVHQQICKFISICHTYIFELCLWLYETYVQHLSFVLIFVSIPVVITSQ